MANLLPRLRVGVYVDVSNLYRNGGGRLRYEVLREFSTRDNAEPMRLNAYVSHDTERADRDSDYAHRTAGFHSALRDLGFKVIVKQVRWYQDENGARVAKANADLDMAVDALLQSENLDRVLIATGDGDFVQVVRALQNKGCRVEILGLDNVSKALREEADFFISGYLVPNLVPVQLDRPEPWGELESRVRGWCYWHHATQSYGFIRYLKQMGPGLWLTDTRHPDSPFESAFFHDSDLPHRLDPRELPSRNLILEFDLVEPERGENLQAVEITLASRL